MPDPTQPQSADIAEQIKHYIRQVNADPDLTERARRFWIEWKRGKIIAPGAVDDKMYESYCEGVTIGIVAAVGYVVKEAWRQAQEIRQAQVDCQPNRNGTRE